MQQYGIPAAFYAAVKINSKHAVLVLVWDMRSGTFFNEKSTDFFYLSSSFAQPFTFDTSALVQCCATYWYVVLLQPVRSAESGN